MLIDGFVSWTHGNPKTGGSNLPLSGDGPLNNLPAYRNWWQPVDLMTQVFLAPKKSL